MPPNPKLAGQVLEAHVNKTALDAERGWMGIMFGMAAEKPGNVAGFTVVIAFLALMCCLIWLPDTGSVTKKDALTIFSSIITLALGYIFGRSSAS